MDISNNDLTTPPATTGGRRKSGRAVKAPEKFIPNAPSSQQGASSSKRKRSEENGENDASDIDEEAEDSDSSIASVAEEEIRQSQRKTKRTKKPAAKKAKTNGTTSHEDAPAVKLPTRPKKSKRVAIADTSADGLYGTRVFLPSKKIMLTIIIADVYTSGYSLDDVATQWLDRFKEDSPEALTEWVNFILKSCGCDLQVTVHDINDPDNADGRIGDLQEEFQAVSNASLHGIKNLAKMTQKNITDYPLISKVKSAHAFRASLVGFIDKLIEVLHKSDVLYEDPTLLENIHAWIAPLTSSSSRPFRHTATLIALTITSSLCRVANIQTEQAGKFQRQLDGEKKKRGTNKARLADFKSKVEENERNNTFVKHQIKDFYQTIYTLRYRDVDPKIRLECVEALGDWILTLAEIFYDGEYLRYMGWMLSDTHGLMRHEVVKQLQRIMKNLNLGTIRHFIERFRPRIIEIATRDSEPGVRASAVELMDLIRSAGMLDPDDIDVIGKLIFDTEPRVRKAVVGFFTENLNDLYDAIVEELGGEEALEGMSSAEDEDDFDTPRPVWIRYKCLAESLMSYDSQDQDDIPSQIESVDILNTSSTESRFTLAAQALYDKLPGLEDWEVLAGYLLHDHTSNPKARKDTESALRNAYRPAEREELILLEVLNAVVKLNLTHTEDSSRSKKKLSKTEIAEAKEATARKLAGLIPRLLKKYGADPKTATVVLRLEHVLNLGVFQELRQDSTVYAKLLDEISAQFNGHADKNVLTEAGAALLHARGYEELEEVTENKMISLWEDTTNTLRKLNKAGKASVRGGFREKILRELSHNLARLEQLASISNPVETFEEDGNSDARTPISILVDIVARGQFEESNDDALDALEDEVVLSAIRSVMFYFMWKTRDLTTAVEAGSDIPDSDVDQLRDLQDTFITNLVSSFSSRATLDPVRLLGAGTYLDLHVLFTTLRSPKKSEDSSKDPDDHLQSLVTDIPPEVQQELASIFDGLEKQYAKKAKKKLAEPGDDDLPEDLDDEPEDEDEDDVTDSERQAEVLKAEQQLCELTGKLVLAILAKVIDTSGPSTGKLRTRIQRNRARLGPNFKEVVAYLDEPKPKAKKSHKSKAQQAATAKKKAAQSAEVVEEDEDEEDPIVDDEPEEGTEEDLRRRELLEEDPADSPDAEDGAGGAEQEEEDDDEIMGD
jgi:cohesin complex subunit SA-1/2